MKTVPGIMLLAALAALPLAAADAGLLNLVMPDARVIMGVQVDQARNSPFGRFVLSQMQNDSAQFARLTAETGFDPRYDLREVIVASADESGKGNPLVLARGKFDAGKIRDFARREGAAASNYRGTDVLVSGKGNRVQWLAFPGADAAVAGDEDAVRAALDRLPRSAPTLDAATLARITDLSARYDAWLVSRAGVARLAESVRDPNVAGAMRGNLMQSVEQAYGGVRFGDEVEIAAELLMRSDRDAQAMEDVVRFLGQMMGGQNRDPRAGKLLDAMKLTSEGRIFRMSLSIPEAQIEELVKGGKSHARHRAP